MKIELQISHTIIKTLLIKVTKTHMDSTNAARKNLLSLLKQSLYDWPPELPKIPGN